MLAGTFDQFRSFDRRVWVLFASQLIASIGFSVVIPFLAIYFHDRLGVSMSLVGTVFLSLALMGAIGQLTGGLLADRFGRRRVMLLSVSIRAVIFAMVSLAIASSQGFFAISALVVVSFLMGSMFEPAANAMVADVVEPGRRLEAFSLLRIGVNIGWAVGPMMGGFLAAVSYSSLFLLTALTGAISATLICLWIEESIHRQLKGGDLRLRELASIRRDTNFTIFCVASFVMFIVVSQMSSTLSVFSNEQVGLPEVEIGYLYSINGLMVVLLQFPIARCLGRFRMSRALVMGAVVYAVGYFLVGIAPAFIFMALCMTIITLGELIVSPSSMNLVAKLSPENERGRYMGVFGLSGAMGWSLGPFIGGVLIDTVVDRPLLLWGTIALISIIAAAVYAALGRRIGTDLDVVAG